MKEMSLAAHPDLLLRPEAAWAQVTLFIPVTEPSPDTGRPGAPEWQRSVAEFPVRGEPGMCTDRQWRSVRIAMTARATLYDQRWHAVLGTAAELARNGVAEDATITLTCRQLEFLPTGIKPGFGPGGILIVHAETHGATGPRPGERRLPVRWLASVVKDLARPDVSERPGADRLVGGWGLSLHPGPEILVAANLALGEKSLRALRSDSAPAGTWDCLSCWTWSLARGTVPAAAALRTPAPPATPGRTVILPHRMAIVDRSGMAITATDPVGRNPDVTGALEDFIPVFQSIYTDVLVLGFLQLLVTAEVGARLDAPGDPVDEPREFHRIETRMQLLHNRFWRVRITEWPWLNQVLRSFQEENDLPMVIGQLGQNIRDIGNQIERRYQHGLNLILLLLSALGFVGVVAGVFATVAALMTMFGTGHQGAIIGIAATSAALLALVVGTVLLLARSGAWHNLTGFMRWED
jgi:hypothetical protein